MPDASGASNEITPRVSEQRRLREPALELTSFTGRSANRAHAPRGAHMLTSRRVGLPPRPAHRPHLSAATPTAEKLLAAI